MRAFQHFLLETPGLHRNQSLNPALWDGDVLKPEVRTTLLNFGEAWRSFAKIPAEDVVDVLLVGGNAGFFYNDASDIDVHLLLDKTRLGMGSYTEDYLRDKKALWTSRYDVRVRGYQIEPYAQDISEAFTSGQGVYSLLHNTWIQRPTESTYDPSTDEKLAHKSQNWERAIDNAIAAGTSLDDMSVLKDKIENMRGEGLHSGGELSLNNLVFKNLRLSGALDRMQDYVKRKKAGELSLT